MSELKNKQTNNPCKSKKNKTPYTAVSKLHWVSKMILHMETFKNGTHPSHSINMQKGTPHQLSELLNW